MSSVSSIASNNTLLAQLAASGKMNANSTASSINKISGTYSDKVNASNSTSSSTPAYTLSSNLSNILSGANSTSDSIYSSIKDAYTAGQKFANSIINQRNTLNDLIKSYGETKSQFQAEYASNLYDLNEASSKMQNQGFYVKGANDEDTAKNVENVVKNVSNFVKAFNENQEFLNKNSDVSKRVSSLANSFGDNKYYANTLSKVGISVGDKGTLSVDTEKLSKALTDNNSAASYVLEGLARRTDNKTVKAANQMEKVFPSISAMMGSDIESTKKLYSANTLAVTNKYEGIGSMLNLYF